jgi:hypothetical protein
MSFSIRRKIPTKSLRKENKAKAKIKETKQQSSSSGNFTLRLPIIPKISDIGQCFVLYSGIFL